MRKYLLGFLFFIMSAQSSPFDYDLHIAEIPGQSGKTIICCHGMTGNYQIAEVIHSYDYTQDTLIGFNFPDHDYDGSRPEKTTFGSIDELLPVLYVLKKTIIDEGRKQVSLYGFSAGGGAVVNVIAALYTTTYDPDLAKIGIGLQEKKQILETLQNGTIILDAPLKSIEEIIAFRGTSLEFEILDARYRKNGMNPIDTLKRLSNLSLNIILNFQHLDEVLSNRDDNLFIQRLKAANSLGSTQVVKGEGSHSFPHDALWQSLSDHP